MPPSPTRRRVFTISSRAATRGRDRVSPNRFSVTSAAAGSQAGAARTRGISLPLLPVADGEGDGEARRAGIIHQIQPTGATSLPMPLAPRIVSECRSRVRNRSVPRACAKPLRRGDRTSISRAPRGKREKFSSPLVASQATLAGSFAYLSYAGDAA